ncbi:MAG: VCBS repeat-containing protein [Bacteroidetes bacterium]|jgi:hypothetical protein|nr:VCBS repeat-containing protein [Bacteroidota bacterium]MDF1864320.1 VCBS repeat-containing protein [Saprospiraceae bacterium]
MNKFFKFFTLVFLLSCSENPSENQTLFTSIPSSQTNIKFKNQLEESNDWNIIKYLYYYNGGGVAVGDINNDGLTDIYLSANQNPTKLYLNKGDFEFEDITEKAGVSGNSGKRAWKTGVSMADVNGDGWLDIYVCQVGFYKAINGQNELYINNQDGTFTEKAAAFGLDFKGFSQQAAFFDYDWDGDLDLYLLNHSVHSAETFTSAENRQIRDEEAGDRFYKNENGKFIDVSENAGISGGSMGYGLGVVIADLNNDGWSDIYVTNDFHENDYLYYNNGNGTFREDIKNSVGHTSTFSMGCDIADFDNDGWLDIVTLDMKPESEKVLKASAGIDHYNKHQHKISYGYHPQFPRNHLQRNMGILSTNDEILEDDKLEVAGTVNGNPPLFLSKEGAKFADIAQLSKVATTDWSWSSLLADFDNDGWKDLYITNGIFRRPNDLDYLKFASNDEIQRSASDMELADKMPSGVVSNYAFRNQGNLLFENVSKTWGLDLEGCSNGAAYADFDNDGDLDLVVNNLNMEAAVYRNNTERKDANYLKIKLVQKNKNKFGVGAKVTLTIGNEELTQEISPIRGWQSSMGYVLNFGIGKATKVDEIHVEWAPDKRQVLENIEVNQLLTIEENAHLEIEAKENSNSLFSDISDQMYVDFSHRENRFVDFNVEGLMPKMLSQEGPNLAKGDVNADGLEDFFVCGSKAQAGMIFIQKQNSTFEQKMAFEEDKMLEDADATFFDFDNDGDLDLYVVSGGGEYREGTDQLRDRIYLNDGRGNFSKKKDAIPEIALNGSCVVSADFNSDGFIDLFVGSRSLVGSYGTSPESVVLINQNGQAFKNAAKEVFSGFNKLGMVTDAIWIETSRQLVVVGDWMPITFFDFQNEKARRTVLNNTNGWWNTVVSGDFDKDGDEDLIVGNLGTNSNLIASSEQPVRLWIKDFDKNYQIDPIMTYYRGGTQYVYHSKDDLVGQLTALRKVFIEYELFAKSTFNDIFPAETMADVVKKEAKMFESVFVKNLGDGSYEVIPLPLKAQFAPIEGLEVSDFNMDGNLDVLAVGNFVQFQPSIGQLDASYGWVLKGDGQGEFEIMEPRNSGFSVIGQGRDIEYLKGQDGHNVIIVSRNNNSLQFFEKLGEEGGR